MSSMNDFVTANPIRELCTLWWKMGNGILQNAYLNLRQECHGANFMAASLRMMFSLASDSSSQNQRLSKGTQRRSRKNRRDWLSQCRTPVVCCQTYLPKTGFA